MSHSNAGRYKNSGLFGLRHNRIALRVTLRRGTGMSSKIKARSLGEDAMQESCSHLAFGLWNLTCIRLRMQLSVRPH